MNDSEAPLLRLGISSVFLIFKTRTAAHFNNICLLRSVLVSPHSGYLALKSLFFVYEQFSPFHLGTPRTPPKTCLGKNSNCRLPTHQLRSTPGFVWIAVGACLHSNFSSYYFVSERISLWLGLFIMRISALLLFAVTRKRFCTSQLFLALNCKKMKFKFYFLWASSSACLCFLHFSVPLLWLLS